MRTLDARNAFVMSTLLQGVTRYGTAAKAQAAAQAADIYGKTGTTNDSMDAWFAGYQRSVTAVVWIGYDNPRKLGDRETGGGLSLPVWIEWMAHALKGVPVQEPDVPEGVVQSGARLDVRRVRPRRRRAEPGPGGQGARGPQHRGAQQHPRPVPALSARVAVRRFSRRQRPGSGLPCRLAWRTAR
jgi:membrane carboxypeptidase/penicillin-binding protein